MRKRFIGLMLAIVFAFSMTACNTEDKDATESMMGEPATEEATEENNEEVAQVEEDIVVTNPTWDRYVSPACKPAADTHISLTETSKDKTDWLDTEKWAKEHGFGVAYLPYSDDTYTYQPMHGGEFGYQYTSLYIYENKTNSCVYSYDLGILCNGPDDLENELSLIRQSINWAEIIDDVLYVSISHMGYAEEEYDSAYMVAIDLNTNEVLWKSEPLTANYGNFKIVDDTIICGYGFTAEPDFLYLLDKNTGERVDEIPLESAPYQFEIVDDTLYLATYNTAYEFKINK